jgi:transcriptional regulator with XRE-family HTH domain
MPTPPTDRQRQLWYDWGCTIQEARRKAGLTQKQLAAEMGRPVMTVRAWEIGHKPPGLANRRWLCERLRIDRASLDCEADHCERCGHTFR